jgi:hypothetical protein
MVTKPKTEPRIPEISGGQAFSFQQLAVSFYKSAVSAWDVLWLSLTADRHGRNGCMSQQL